MKERKGFTFFRSFQDTIDQCEEKDQLALYRGIVYYALNRTDPDFANPLLKVIWTLIKPVLDTGWRGFDNGCNGGAPVGNSNARKTTKRQPKNNQKTTKNNQPPLDKGYRMKDEDNVSIETKKEYKEKADKPLSPSPASERYLDFQNWLSLNCPHLNKMEQPTEEQFQKLIEKAGSVKALSDILLAMENDTNTPKKRRSIYLTACNWLNRDKK